MTTTYTPWYNMSKVSGPDFLTFIQAVNQYLVLDMLGLLIVIGIFAVTLISLHYYWPDSKANFMVSSFLAMIISMFFVTINLMQGYIAFIFFGLFAASVIVTILSMD